MRSPKPPPPAIACHQGEQLPLQFVLAAGGCVSVPAPPPPPPPNPAAFIIYKSNGGLLNGFRR